MIEEQVRPLLRPDLATRSPTTGVTTGSLAGGSTQPVPKPVPAQAEGVPPSSIIPPLGSTMVGTICAIAASTLPTAGLFEVPVVGSVAHSDRFATVSLGRA